ncbi:MAG: pilus assembly PilX family protein [Fluviibacter sp.]
MLLTRHTLLPLYGAQSGIAMVISLILLLVITAMGLGIAYVATVQSDMVAAIANKPVSIEAADTCFDHALEWLQKPAGQSWVNGEGLPLDLAVKGGPLAGKTLQADTVPLGQSDSRAAAFMDRAGRASYSSCIVEKLSSTTNGNTGNEIGTSNGYGSSNFVYVIRLTAQGDFNVPLNGSAIDTRFWQSGSSRSVVEAVVQYTP